MPVYHKILEADCACKKPWGTLKGSQGKQRCVGCTSPAEMPRRSTPQDWSAPSHFECTEGGSAPTILRLQSRLQQLEITSERRQCLFEQRSCRVYPCISEGHWSSNPGLTMPIKNACVSYKPLLGAQWHLRKSGCVHSRTIQPQQEWRPSRWTSPEEQNGLRSVSERCPGRMPLPGR